MEKPDKFKKYDKNLLWETPIEIYGLRVYPITMRNIYDFRESISTLQINPMELDFGEMSEQLSALSYLELVAIFSHGDEDFRNRLYTILKLAFRVSDESIRILVQDDKVTLVVIQNGKEIKLSSGKFNRVKDIILYQNSVEIINLNENQRILEANRRVDALNAANSTVTIEDEIYSVAAASQIDIKEIEKWTINRFKKMVETYDNFINYKIFKSAEMSGFVKFKGGNPFKSWMSRTEDTTKQLKTVQELAKTFGMNAPNGAQNSGQK